MLRVLACVGGFFWGGGRGVVVGVVGVSFLLSALFEDGKASGKGNAGAALPEPSSRQAAPGAEFAEVDDVERKREKKRRRRCAPLRCVGSLVQLFPHRLNAAAALSKPWLHRYESTTDATSASEIRAAEEDVAAAAPSSTTPAAPPRPSPPCACIGNGGVVEKSGRRRSGRRRRKRRAKTAINALPLFVLSSQLSSLSPAPSSSCSSSSFSARGRRRALILFSLLVLLPSSRRAL